MTPMQRDATLERALRLAREEAPSASVRERTLARMRQAGSTHAAPSGGTTLRFARSSALIGLPLIAAASALVFLLGRDGDGGRSGPDDEPLLRAEEVASAPQRMQRDAPQLRETPGPPPATSACVPKACAVVRPSDALVTDFTDVSDDGVFVDGDRYSDKPDDWWLGFYGSTYVYPRAPGALTSSSAEVWKVTGTVDAPSGFGLWLGACTVDLSEYRGISFDLWGRAGPSSELSFIVDTGPNSRPERCRSNVGSCDALAGPCESPKKRLRVPRTRRTLTVLWSELLGGKPRATPAPEAILQFRFAFDPKGRSAPYQVELFIDDVRLVR